MRSNEVNCSYLELSTLEQCSLKQKGFQVDVRTVKRYRARIRKSAQNWVAKLGKSKRAEYIACYDQV
ncbi:MAG: hypothetical protein JO297_20780 [Nitrososphaeraceae archaeon]|nr:hypothetical protein [Nitrososphaeraceae archaeon]